MKDKIFGVLQRVGRSFMLPIAILPVAGLLLGLGGSFTNETMLEAYGLLNVMGPGTIINDILQIMNSAGNIVFANLPIIFSMGVAIGMAKKEKEVAALSAVVAFFIAKPDMAYRLLPVLKGKTAYAKWTFSLPVCAVLRLLWYGYSALFSLAVLVLAPERPSFLSVIGSRTMTIYAWHYVPMTIFYSTFAGKKWLATYFPACQLWIVLLLSILFTVILAWPPFVSVTEFLVYPPFLKKIRSSKKY